MAVSSTEVTHITTTPTVTVTTTEDIETYLQKTTTASYVSGFHKYTVNMYIKPNVMSRLEFSRQLKI